MKCKITTLYGHVLFEQGSSRQLLHISNTDELVWFSLWQEDGSKNNEMVPGWMVPMDGTRSRDQQISFMPAWFMPIDKTHVR